ncbi:MAG: T9SS type A sorting domain-containing protein [Flavobacteriales bacterium]|nr:T9SS type A sorting domain-containing protein [Flavobacteriales bacterium]MCB9364383.1 T9SS type A sorting domain-containing protein [Flavobacteriales bacterium]
MKKINSLLLCGLISTAIIAQERSKNWCYTDQNAERLHQENPLLIQQNQELEELTKEYSLTNNQTAKKATIIIPVVVHNITHDGGIGYVSKATIEAQINRLNIDFNRLNSDTTNTRALFKPHASSIDIEFRLAHLDPNGECTEGIVRKESPLSFNGGDAVKAVSYWDSKKYFNIWVVDAIEQNPDGSYVAGYAQFPGDGIDNTYGVVCVNQNFSGNDRTLTHEIGHCFNLLHTFNYGYCGGGGDGCSDTPPVYESTFDCDPNRNTCSNDGTYYGGDVVDQFENYMSYASCQNMFTIQQASRMMTVLNNTSTNYGLKQLWDSGNLAVTGVSDPYDPNPICIPVDPNFTYSKQYICEGDQISFADLGTYNATPTLWDWTFIGGTPSSSSQASPIITYNTTGVYDVSYSPGTTAGWATPIVKSNLVVVSSIAANYTIPFSEGFENSTTVANDWRIETTNGSGWVTTTQASYTGNTSYKVNNITNSVGNITEAISPSYDLSSINNPQLYYSWAFAQKLSAGNDLFVISYSLDCGGTWTPLAFKAGTSMATASSTNSSFIPSSQAEWGRTNVSLNNIASETNVRFKFYFKSGGGNNFYLDDINLDALTGIDEKINANTLKIFPNPMESNASLSFTLNANVKNLNIIIRDVLGKEVAKIVNSSSFSAGKYTMNIDKGNKLSKGLYFIEFNADENVKIEKLIVK